MIRSALLRSFIACQLLCGVACGDVAVNPTEDSKEPAPKTAETLDTPRTPDSVDEPGIVLFNLTKTGRNDPRPAYYGVTNDPNPYPNNEMFEAIAKLPKNNRLWTIYPDAFPEADDRLVSWRDFDVHQWNGTDPLPRMRPQSYVTRIESLQKAGTLPGDLSGYSFLIDWEHGATAVREMGLTYWSDASSPRFRMAWTAYRNQVVETLRTLQARFPNSFFTVYGGGSPARTIGLSKDRSAPVVKNPDGTMAQKYYLHDVSESVLQTIRKNYAEAMGPLLEAPDFHTVACYDAYGPLDWDDRGGFPPSKNESYLVETFRLLKDNSTRPVYGIVGSFTHGNRNLQHEGVSNGDYQMYWKDRSSWLKRTCRWIANGDADGAVVWNGLDALIFSYLKLNIRSYDELNAEARKYFDPDHIDGWNQWISLDRQSGTLFKELARLHGQPNTRNYESARRYYDNIPFSQRQSDATIDVFLKTMSRTWNEYLLTDLLSTLQTGIVPLHVEDAIEVRSDRKAAAIGSTLYVVDRMAGEIDSIEYQWMRNGEPIGSASKNPVHRITQSDVGRTLECKVTYRPKDGSDPIVRIGRFDRIITSPTLATIDVIQDGSEARATFTASMVDVFGVEGIEPFTITAGAPIILRTNEGVFDVRAGRSQVWTVENGRKSVTIRVPSESVTLDGDTLVIDDKALSRTLMSGFKNVVTGISITPSP